MIHQLYIKFEAIKHHASGIWAYHTHLLHHEDSCATCLCISLCIAWRKSRHTQYFLCCRHIKWAFISHIYQASMCFYCFLLALWTLSPKCLTRLLSWSWQRVCTCLCLNLFLLQYHDGNACIWSWGDVDDTQRDLWCDRCLKWFGTAANTAHAEDS